MTLLIKLLFAFLAVSLGSFAVMVVMTFMMAEPVKVWVYGN